MNAQKKNTKEFMRYTVGLTAWKNRKQKLVKTAFYRLPDGSVLLEAVSGRNLDYIGGRVTISAEKYSDRPYNPFNATREAIWALDLCGWDVGEDAPEGFI